MAWSGGLTPVRSAVAELTASSFAAIGELLLQVSGIQLAPGKETMVVSRLQSRVRELGLDGFDAYVHLLRSDTGKEEIARMVDLLTTNKTDFFREPAHFDFMRTVDVPQWQATQRPVRIWSAACSSGEEPVTIAMVLAEALPNWSRRDVRILATDISPTILAKAKAAAFGREALEGVPEDLRRRYFHERPDGLAEADRSLRDRISFAQLNLMGEWPMKGPFDVIFCRNVMIYFDKPTQERLVQRLGALLRPGGHLFIGHAESVNPARVGLDYVRPATYERP